MKVLNYLVFVLVLIFILFLSGVVFATIGLIKHREDKKLYMSNVISSASISTIALVVCVICISFLKSM